MVWSKRRRSSVVPPVLLPSLDRLATLIDRVVELVDAVGGSQAPEPEPASEPPREPAAVGAEAVAWLAFVPSAHGYRLVERTGSAPSSGEVLELDDGLYRVVRLVPSPLPQDGRLCAYVEREEPPAEDRTFERERGEPDRRDEGGAPGRP